MAYLNERATIDIDMLRAFETEIADDFRNGRIHSPVHFSHGNEEQLIRVFRGIREGEYCTRRDGISRTEIIERQLIELAPNAGSDHPAFRGIASHDWLFVSYRSHYHALLKGIPRDWIKQEILNGRSMYLMSREYQIFSSAIVPGHLPIAVGMAFALKHANDPRRVWAFCGDMASETGAFDECTKYALAHDLPITFVIEDNGLSVDTPTRAVWNAEPHSLRTNTIRYAYHCGVPHQGMGKEVGF